MAGVADAGRDERNRAIGALIWKDPRRILEVASRLRGGGAVLECRLRGASMGAAMPSGSRLRIDLRATQDLRVGEVVAFVREHGICVHRVAHCGRAGLLVTQGDACLNPDPPLAPESVLGRVVAYASTDEWRAVPGLAAPDRACSAPGRALVRLVAVLMAVDVRLAAQAVRLLRLRTEAPARAEPP